MTKDYDLESGQEIVHASAHLSKPQAHMLKVKHPPKAIANNIVAAPSKTSPVFLRKRRYNILSNIKLPVVLCLTVVFRVTS